MNKFFYLVLAICGAFVSCSKENDAEAIRALIKKSATLAEKHDIAGLLELATEDFRAKPGNLDRREIRGVLWRTFKYYGPLKVLYPRPAVEIKGEAGQASVKLPFLIVKKEQTYPGLQDLRADTLAWLEKVGENADLYRFILHFVKQDDNWLVSRVFLERFTGLGFEQ